MESSETDCTKSSLLESCSGSPMLRLEQRVLHKQVIRAAELLKMGMVDQRKEVTRFLFYQGWSDLCTI